MNCPRIWKKKRGGCSGKNCPSHLLAPPPRPLHTKRREKLSSFYSRSFFFWPTPSKHTISHFFLSDPISGGDLCGRERRKRNGEEEHHVHSHSQEKGKRERKRRNGTPFIHFRHLLLNPFENSSFWRVIRD